MGPNGPVALNMLAIDKGMDDYSVDPDERVEFSIKVRNIANMIFSWRAEEAEHKAQLAAKAKK